MQCFSIRDNASATYDQPFLRPNVVTAIRSITDALNDPASPWAKHPEDYALYHLGEWDDTTGEFNSHAPQHITNLIDLTVTGE